MARSAKITSLSLLAAVALAAPAVTVAEDTPTEIPTPTIKVKARAVPIPGFAGTGNFYGKGADVESTFEIEGSGYGVTPQNPKGSVPPISAVNVYLPRGVVLHTSGFGQCTEEILKIKGPSSCPKKSIASQKGSVLGEVTFGAERVPEEATLQAFFGPHGGLLFFTHGATPVNLEIVSSGKFVRSSGKYSWELKTLVPPVASVTGAALASARKIHIKVGAAYRSHGKVISYGTVPKKGQCPHGGFFGKTEVVFGGISTNPERDFSIPAKTVTKVIRVPCPKR